MNLGAEELRILGLCAPALMKLLEARETRILNRIYGDYRNGKLDQTAALAEWASVRDQINEITAALRVHEKQEANRHANTTDDGNAD